MKPEEKKPKLELGFDAQKIKSVLLNFVVPLIAFGISLIIILVVIYPSFKNLPKIKSELATKAALKQTLTTKLLTLNKLVDFKTVVEEDSNLVNKVLVLEEQVPRLLDEVNQIATDSGMSVTRLSYSYGNTTTSSDTAAKKAYSSVTISLGTDSSYDQIIVFLQAAENAARFLSVPNFRYASGMNATGEKKLSSSFALDSPYLSVQSTAVTDDPITLDISSQGFVTFINMIKSLKYYEFINPNIEVVKTPEVSETTPSATQ